MILINNTEIIYKNHNKNHLKNPRFKNYKNHHQSSSSSYRAVRLQGYIPYPHIAAVCMFELDRPAFARRYFWGP